MKIKTLIAAGGLGKRLQGFRGNESTKVLLEVNNTPMITLQIQKLIEWGLDDFVYWIDYSCRNFPYST